VGQVKLKRKTTGLRMVNFCIFLNLSDGGNHQNELKILKNGSVSVKNNFTQRVNFVSNFALRRAFFNALKNEPFEISIL
jgi:hypothetical protein